MFSSSTNTVLKYELLTNYHTSGQSVDHFLPANSAQHGLSLHVKHTWKKMHFGGLVGFVVVEQDDEGVVA